MRLFIAVDLEHRVLSHVEALVAEHRSLAPRSRWQAPDNWHVTLSFLGEVAETRVTELAAVLRAAALRHAPFSLTVRSAGGFPEAARPRVLWLGIGGDTPALASLKADIDAGIEHLVSSAERREYHPHLTLARSARRGGDRELGACATALQGVSLEASRIGEVILYHSRSSPDGVRYTPLLRAALSGARSG